MHTDRRRGGGGTRETTREKDGLIAVGGKEINAHLECVNHSTLTRN